VISKGLANIANNDLEQKFTVEVKLNEYNVSLFIAIIPIIPNLIRATINK